MIRWLLHKMTRQFEARYRYNGDYMHEVYDISTSAGIRLSMLPLLSQYRGPNIDIWAGAALASVLDGDCGPCAQLVVDMAVEAGASAEHLTRCAQGDAENAATVGLGYRFACAAIHDDPQANDLREEIILSYGKEASLAAAFTAATSRAYPVLKRALGHGAVCSTLNIGEHRNVRIAAAS
jgi:hypothetical protein